MILNAKRALIVGTGMSGKSAFDVLSKHGCQCEMCEDGNCIPEKPMADLIVVSPGVPSTSRIFDYARKNSIRLIGELELGWILNGEKDVVAITGTNGKTTVTEMVGNIAGRVYSTKVCGNIGIPFSQVANEGDYEKAVVETSSFQLETIENFCPHIACITNIACDHLDRHGTVEGYARAKLRIAENQAGSDFLVLSDDIPVLLLKDFFPHSQIYYTSLERKVRGAYWHGDHLMFMNEKICRREDISLVGDFNVRNALSAICICRLLDIDPQIIREGIVSFDTAAHRLKMVGKVRGRTYYDDSKGTNISATICACTAMKGDTLLILGGSDKGYSYDLLFEKLPNNIKEIALIGETADKIEKSALFYGFSGITRYASLEDAVKYASTAAVKNVLLSPASASFDMFKNYSERGDAFIRAVEELER
ncbi:MAG: UDP-N-acetylmuramoyl-L-alanine--D-glutamate ligase [Clostridia bacterium]|nr:UDP-N-acetylmuramoyl-L-alanine--D-glutamate ligase [Clostridia bacterium]